jgi:outer membrane biosynthesis protein TonB
MRARRRGPLSRRFRHAGTPGRSDLAGPLLALLLSTPAIGASIEPVRPAEPVQAPEPVRPAEPVQATEPAAPAKPEPPAEPAKVCKTNKECPAADLCSKPAGKCGAAGTCTKRPARCPGRVKKPVCGCDGKTYKSACRAAKAGAAVWHAGRCETS